MPATPFKSARPADGSRLRHALAASAVLHLLGVAIPIGLMKCDRPREVETETVDVEIAPAPPTVEALPRDIAAPPERNSPSDSVLPKVPETPDQPGPLGGPRDAGVDAAVDPAPPKKHRPRPAQISELPADRERDSPPSLSDGNMDGASSESAIAASSGETSGLPNSPAIDGAPTSAGTAANLLAYLPSGHVVTALVRFDRMRDTEWAYASETLLHPLPDYRALFGDRDAAIRNKLDMLVISSPRPRDPTATTLIMKTERSRAEVRELLANPAAPIDWSTTQGGLLGQRPATVLGMDRRVLLSPWQRWYLLVGSADLGGLTAPTSGELDLVEVTGDLPKWLSKIRAIEKESGDAKRGPALVVTLGALRDHARTPRRYSVPDFGLGVSSLPAPTRATIAMELVPRGWLVRGYLAFSTDADAAEFVQSVTGVQQRVLGSQLLSALVARQYALNAIKGLSMLRVGARVSYSTSLSISDARAVLAAASSTVAASFGSR